MDKNLSLRELRENLKMTQQELADRLGMARAYISAVERGASPFSEKFKEKVKNLSFSDGIPVLPLDNPPTWAEAQEARLNGNLKVIREQLSDIQALLVKLAGK